MHDLARLFADSRLDPTARAEAQQRHAAHYESVYRAATEFYEQGGDNILLGLALFDREWVNIQAGQAWAEKNTTNNNSAAALCSAYADSPYLLELRQHPRERIRWLESALTAARRLQDRAMEGAHLGNLGRAYADLGETRRAIEYHEQDLAIEREIGDRRGEGNALTNLGSAYFKLREYAKAVEYYQKRLTIAQEIGDRWGEGSALWGLAICFEAAKDMTQAITHAEAALEIFTAIESPSAQKNA